MEWKPIEQKPEEDGEYLVCHFGMKNGLRTRPYIDRDYFEDGSWQSHDYITHWANIEYPHENPPCGLTTHAADVSNATDDRLCEHGALLCTICDLGSTPRR